MSRFNQKEIVVIRSVDFSSKGKDYIKEDVFGRLTSFHSNKAILKMNIKQHLSLPCICTLGDPLLEYAYNFSLVKSTISHSLSNPL